MTFRELWKKDYVRIPVVAGVIVAGVLTFVWLTGGFGS